VNSHEKRVAVLQNKRIEEFYIERADTVNLVGNIYKGKVESVLPGIEAAFVNIGLEKNGFLYVTDAVSGIPSYEKLLEEEAGEEFGEKAEGRKPLPAINEVVKKGDDVLVQVEKEPISTKGPRLTTHISIPGRFLVLMPFDNHIGLSKRIEDRKERDRIRQIFEKLKLPKDIGFIVRTIAQGADEKDFAREANYLLRLWQQIQQKARKARPPQLVHEEHDLILRVTRDLLDDKVARLEVDSKNEFRRIMHFLRIYSPHLRARVRWHRDRIPVFEKFGVEEQIDKIYNRIVNLKSGGYLVFDETESLVAIDVNSGKSVRGKNLEDTAFRTNMEAAAEVPRQLKMRDIGGIIIIDFIDMEVHGHRKAVVAALERALEDDKAKSKILNISSIGLVEMTRQRMRKSVEGKSYQKCPYCNGRGTVKSAPTVSIDLMRKLERALFEAPSAREVFVSLHPEVAAYVSAPEKNMIKPLEKRFRKTIRIVEDPNQHLEDVKIDIVK